MEKAHQVTVVIVPLPCQSHLNQLLRLAALISSHNLPVHFLGSATHNRQAQLRHGPNPNPIHFHDLPTPPIDTPDPSTNSDKQPVHLGPAIFAYMALRRPIADRVQQISTKTNKIVLIYDRFIADAVTDAVSIPGVEESYAFNCLSGFNLFYILWESLDKPFPHDQEKNIKFSVKDFCSENTLEFMVSKPPHFKNRAGDIHNTIRLIDGKYIDLLSREEIGGKRQQWAISPLLKPESVFNNHGDTTRHGCLAWLDRQAPGSVIYVSFGTTISLSESETREIALGLEQSRKKFLWVLREADRSDIFAKEVREIGLPDGFEERVRGRGLVVRDWAPQMEILAHEATGGFMSHCGWNSCFESLVAGVPVLAWPMHSDQPLNAIFMTGVLKTGLAVREWAERGEMVGAAVVKDGVERLMGSGEGDEVRKRAVEISLAVGEEAGELRREMESFIAHISR